MNVNVKQALIIGLTLGLTAAVVVWFLERFESDRLHSEVSNYLHRYDEFRKWDSQQKKDET